MRLLSAIRQDFRFQFRHRFYHAYLMITLVYLGILYFIPPDLKIYAVSFVIFSDPSVLGFFFVGGILLLEKEQNILDALFITPLTPREFLLGKALSLSFIAILASLGIALLALPQKFSILALVLVVTLSALCYTLLGISLAVRVKTLNQYLIQSMLYIPLFLPLLHFFRIWRLPLLTLLPAYGTLTSLEAIFLGEKLPWYPLFLLIIWVFLSYYLAKRAFTHYILEKIGG